MRLAEDATLRHVNSWTCVLEGWVKRVGGCESVRHWCVLQMMLRYGVLALGLALWKDG